MGAAAAILLGVFILLLALGYLGLQSPPLVLGIVGLLTAVLILAHVGTSGRTTVP